MNKLKSFLMGFALLVIVFIAVILAALIYRANDQMSVKSYIFQMNNDANQRVGTLQDINDISAEELLTRLIHKYVSEYFKVIPGDTDVTDRPILSNLSSKKAFQIWKDGEAKIIAKRSESKMFRIATFPQNSIEPLNKPSGYNYEDDGLRRPVFYAVHYETYTWTQSNMMGMDNPPAKETGTLYIEVEFTAGIRKTIEGKTFDIKKYLEKGKNPVGLFMFEVTDIKDQGM